MGDTLKAVSRGCDSIGSACEDIGDLLSPVFLKGLKPSSRTGSWVPGTGASADEAIGDLLSPFFWNGLKSADSASATGNSTGGLSGLLMGDRDSLLGLEDNPPPTGPLLRALGGVFASEA